MIPTLTRNYVADGAIEPYRFVKPGSADGEVAQAAAATNAIIGATSTLGAADTERVDVQHAGVADIELGGAVTRGGEVTSDANGKAVAAAPATGANNRIGGIALVSGVAGDIVPVLLAFGTTQGA